jgi:murein DD-endopeptidase MepM/ murein hydrolase activator NlpD
MSKKTFRTVITISLLGCLLFYTMNTSQRFRTEVTNLTLDLEKNQNYFYSQIDSVNNVYQGALDSLPLGSPLDTISISSTYGVRRRPLGGGWRMHSGIDLKGTRWDTVFATGSGSVSMAGWNAGYGKCIKIDHMEGYASKYAHLSRVFVRKGDFVTKGTPLGKCGSTGASTGQHLHYEIIINGKTVDPYLFLFFDSILKNCDNTLLEVH